MRNFIGKFLEYDSKVVSLGYTGVLRTRVRIEVDKPLKRKKRIVMPNDSSSFVIFAYEKLTLFCFLCGKLGHGESFCPLLILQEDQILALGWDISLQAPFRRSAAPSIHWLRDKGGNFSNMEMLNFGTTNPMMGMIRDDS